jgi:hypothetical protein
MSDFQINVDLDKSLFSVDVPPGYTVQTQQIDPSRTNWVSLTGALKLAAEHNDGLFPPTLRGEQGIDGIIEHAAKTLAENHAKDGLETLKPATDIIMKLNSALAVLNALPPDAWHYAGKDVKLNTPNRPILWAKNRSGTGYHVIYADLSVKEVSPEEAKKLFESEGSPKP